MNKVLLIFALILLATPIVNAVNCNPTNLTAMGGCGCTIVTSLTLMGAGNTYIEQCAGSGVIFDNNEVLDCNGSTIWLNFTNYGQFMAGQTTGQLVKNCVFTGPGSNSPDAPFTPYMGSGIITNSSFTDITSNLAFNSHYNMNFTNLNFTNINYFYSERGYRAAYSSFFDNVSFTNVTKFKVLLGGIMTFQNSVLKNLSCDTDNALYACFKTDDNYLNSMVMVNNSFEKNNAGYTNPLFRISNCDYPINISGNNYTSIGVAGTGDEAVQWSDSACSVAPKIYHNNFVGPCVTNDCWSEVGTGPGNINVSTYSIDLFGNYYYNVSNACTSTDDNICDNRQDLTGADINISDYYACHVQNCWIVAPPTDTCTSFTTTGVLHCDDNCTFSANQTITANVTITGTGTLTWNSAVWWLFDSATSWFKVNKSDNCLFRGNKTNPGGIRVTK